MKKSAMLFTLLVVVFLAAGVLWVYQQYVAYPVVTIGDILAQPQGFSGRRVAVKGVLVKNVGAYWGGTYSLYPSDTGIAKDSPHIELSVTGISENLVGLTFDGSGFQKRDGCPRVTVKGVFRDRGLVADAPRYFIEVSSITSD